MGKKKSEEIVAMRNGKKEKVSVIILLANHDQEDEEDLGVSDEKQRQMHANEKQLDFSVTPKKKMKAKSHLAAEMEKREARPLLQLIEVSFCYPNKSRFRLSNVDLGIDMGTRVAIVGPNGAGKSTLLNLIAGDLVPTEGEVRRSQKLRIGRYSQHFVDQLSMWETPVEYLLRLYPDQEGCSKQEAVRAKLGKFGLTGENHSTPTAKLSGGQKARVVLTSISMSKPHILLLDEPTNHLDMQTIDALADALDEFKGGVVLVSHDSRLISRVCEDEEKSEIWLVENGTVTFFRGTFEEYKEELIGEIKAEVDELTSLVGC
ncbi:ABC transporter F family member 4 [Arabidopsis lyrata subsp. lyrata]|nr:ABC transporter F family member 4 [Arabidopsis lyrata subsp. lyrata]|eukprot:XP_002883386.2 ABC transporter F family member 4 [Arabidopsis lyrata subsp. lyrata]